MSCPLFRDLQRKPPSRHTIVMTNEVTSRSFWQAVAAEFVGMFFFIFIALSSTSAWNVPYIPSQVQIALAFGLGLGTSIHVTAHISGGHLNPAVSFAFLMLHRITPLRFLFYTLAQSIGAIAAAGMVRAITPVDINDSLGATTPGSNVKEWQAFLMELVITYLLVLVIFATIDKRRPSSGGSGPLAIGIAVLISHLSAIQYSGASMNPARSLGSAVVGGVWTAHWVYWVGPMIGGLLGAITYDYILDPNVSVNRLRRCTTCEYGDEDDYSTSDEMNLNAIQTEAK